MRHIPYFLLLADFWKLACLICFLVSPKYLTCSLVCHPELCWMGSFCQGLGSSFCWAPFPFLLVALGVTARILHSNRQGRDWLETKVFVSTNILKRNKMFLELPEKFVWVIAQERQKKIKGRVPLEKEENLSSLTKQGCKRQLNESATITLTKKQKKGKKEKKKKKLFVLRVCNLKWPS